MTEPKKTTEIEIALDPTNLREVSRRFDENGAVVIGDCFIRRDMIGEGTELGRRVYVVGGPRNKVAHLPSYGDAFVIAQRWNDLVDRERAAKEGRAA